MGNIARHSDGHVIFASDYTEREWDQYRLTAPELIMPCCGTIAVLKTSPNGLPFFAHFNDGCASTPESIWHQQVKEQLAQGIRELGIQAQLEVPGTSPSGKWVADVYFETQGAPFAIEIQHSYQHLRDYRARQARYNEAGVRAFWVLYPPRYATLANSIMKFRHKHEFNGVLPEDQNTMRGMNQTKDLPVVWMDPEASSPIKMPGLNTSEIAPWIGAVIDGRFNYDVDGWRIRK